MEAAVGYGLERGMTLMTWACEGPRVFISLWGSLTRVKMDAHDMCAHRLCRDMSTRWPGEGRVVSCVGTKSLCILDKSLECRVYMYLMTANRFFERQKVITCDLLWRLRVSIPGLNRNDKFDPLSRCLVRRRH